MTYRSGDCVRVADRPHVGHHRTPGYLKGKRGTVAEVHPTFTNPETRAYGGDGQPPVRLYLVEFEGREVFPSGRNDLDRIYADVFEHWLEPAP
jgi:nitrile hydratase subunit beta